MVRLPSFVDVAGYAEAQTDPQRFIWTVWNVGETGNCQSDNAGVAREVGWPAHSRIFIAKSENRPSAQIPEGEFTLTTSSKVQPSAHERMGNRGQSRSRRVMGARERKVV